MGSKITVGGREYKVVETIPASLCRYPAKFVETPKGERVAVKWGGCWQWWTAEDSDGSVGGVIIREETISE